MEASAIIEKFKNVITNAAVEAKASFERVSAAIPSREMPAATHLVGDIHSAIVVAVKHGLSPDSVRVVLLELNDQFDKAYAIAADLRQDVDNFELANIPISGRPS